MGSASGTEGVASAGHRSLVFASGDKRLSSCHHVSVAEEGYKFMTEGRTYLAISSQIDLEGLGVVFEA